METKRRLYFDDGISYVDKSTFIDYPKVKIRGYGSPAGSIFRKIMIYIYLSVISSGIIYLVV
jgi:hypothetical protein